MLAIMDYDDSGTIDKAEFVNGILELCDDMRPMSIVELHYQLLKVSSRVARCGQQFDQFTVTIQGVAEQINEIRGCMRQPNNNRDTSAIATNNKSTEISNEINTL